MKIDLLHNKLIADTVTDKFSESVENVLLPLIESAHGEIDEIQMYEDYLPDNFERDGYWYYPMTALKAGEPFTVWVKWNVSDKSQFNDGVPYAYIGDEPIEFSLCEPPCELPEAIKGRSIYFDNKSVKLTVDTAAPSAAAFLAGKYSQTFIDEMARQLTGEIARAMSVSGLPDSNVELRLIFAPDTYMEHTCENVTYRRLLITDKGCGTKDFWIKWTRNNSAVAYSISDHASEGDVTFELGEDVSQKIREREYRFLVRANTDKYHYSMGRKNITEWRELIKRAIRRGDLTKVLSEIELAEHSNDVHDKLSDILAHFGVPTSASEQVKESTPDTELDIALELAEKAPETENDLEDAPFDFSPYEEENTEQAPKAQDLFAVIDTENEQSEELMLEDCSEIPELDASAEDVITPEEPEYEEATKEVPEYKEALGEITEDTAEEAEIPDKAAEEPIKIQRIVKTIEVPVAPDEERIRAEIEAKLRLEYETAARRRAEEEAFSLKATMDKEREENERLRRDQLLLMQENEKLIREREALELQNAAEIQRRKEEEQRLRDEIEARIKAESRERERLEEAARLAVENQRRVELERLAEERRRIEEEKQREEELRRTEEAARLEAERIKEAERIRYETELSRGNIVNGQANNKTSFVPVFEVESQSYTYTSKAVTLIFKTLVDPNLIKKIQEITLDTVKRAGKEKVSIRVKAKTVDERTVLLDFLKIPEEELQLLIDIVNTLGRSNIGIVKATIK